MSVSVKTVAILGLLVLSASAAVPTIESTSRLENEVSDTTGILALTPSQVDPTVAEIARQVTVRIFTNPGAGSGIIIDRQGQTYTVLTCEHVANPSRDDRYTVLTPDGQTHSAYRKHLPALEGVDLALVQFQSRTPYRVAALGNSQDISIGGPVYASGFPNYHDLSPNAIEDTFDWGLRAFRLTTGTVSMLLSDQSLPRGYQLGYTNDIETGMSGGPVLNQRGQVIGINGRHKYPFQGIEVFEFADGTTPSQKLFERMEALSWAVPISTFQQRTGQLPAATQIRNNLTVPPPIFGAELPVQLITPLVELDGGLAQ